jgi:hypothetical protein
MAGPTGILAMLAKPKGKGGSEKSEPLESDGEGSEAGDALLEMFSALKSGDGAGAELAFKRAMTACEDYEADEDMSELGMDEDETEEE